MNCEVRLISRAEVERGDVAILSDSSNLVFAVAPDPVLKRVLVAVFDRNTGMPILAAYRRDVRGDYYAEGWRVCSERLLYPGVVRDFLGLWESYKAGCNQLSDIFNRRGRVRSHATAKEIIAYYEHFGGASPGVRAAAWFVTSFGATYRIPKRFRA